MGNLKEIINGRIHATITDTLRSYHEVLHDLFYIPVRLRLHNNRLASPKGRHIQIKHIRSLDIRHLTVDIHKLRQIGKLIEPALKTESAAFHRKFQCCCHFTEVCRPCIKMVYSHLLQCRLLQIQLHDIHLAHRVGNRGSRCKNNAPVPVYFTDILTFQLHVRSLLCSR